jgi:H+/Cl- antiporter ClcA
MLLQIQLIILILLKSTFGFTLGAGFKGGEVTPLFFVATLGSALIKRGTSAY